MSWRRRTQQTHLRDDVFRKVLIGKQTVQPTEESELRVIESGDVADRGTIGDSQLNNSQPNQASPRVPDNISDQSQTGTGNDHVQPDRPRHVSCTPVESITGHPLDPDSFEDSVSMLRIYKQ